MRESSDSIGEWILDTFPGGDPDSPRKAIRALEEATELCLAAGATVGEITDAVGKAIGTTVEAECDRNSSAPDPAKVAEEAADVRIVLEGLGAIRGFNLDDETYKKMKINRSRRWKSFGDGTGQHLPETE